MNKVEQVFTLVIILSVMMSDPKRLVSAQCPALSSQNLKLNCVGVVGPVNCSDQVPDGTRVSVLWKRGLGDKVIACKTSKWVRMCPALVSQTVNVKCFNEENPVSCKREVPVGTRATLTCQTGFGRTDKNQDSTIVCMPSGKWDRELITCEPVILNEDKYGHGSALLYKPVEGCGQCAISVSRIAWEKAAQTCAMNNATLLVIDTPRKHNAVLSLVEEVQKALNKTVDLIWDGSKRGKNTSFVTPSGLSIANNNWCPGQPNRQLNEDCGTYWISEMCLNDSHCKHSQGFVCVKK